MASSSSWKVPSAEQPKPQDYTYDLDRALSSVVGLRAIVPPDAFTAETLGTERAGHGVLIRNDGLVRSGSRLSTATRCRAMCWLTIRRPASGWCRRWPG